MSIFTNLTLVKPKLDLNFLMYCDECDFRYTQQVSESSPHSVVYRSTDVSDPSAPACASEELRKRGGVHPEPWLAPSNASSAARRKRWMGRSKRAAAIDPHKTTCMLYLQADHLFHQKFGSEEACIEVMTRHVQRVNSIYQGTGTINSSTTLSIYFEVITHAQ